MLQSDVVTRWFLAAVALGGLLYIVCGWTPSSYGVVLKQLHASQGGPIAGSGREIREDEYAVSTPFLQAAVRNRFRRVNETSFYHEDLRNFFALPLADWSLVFKPQLWAFFVVPPATAFSIYFAVLMCGCLAGYQLLFRQLGTAPGLAVAAALIVYFSGFTQFWWTTYGPLISGLPWIVLIILQPLSWWKKALLCSWAMPAFGLSLVYPTLMLALGWGVMILILAFRPAVLRSVGNIAAIVGGAIALGVVFYAYYGDVIAIMRNTIYPGRRISPSGGTSIFVVLSEFFPFLGFRLGDYENLMGPNICEIGTMASYLPLLTLCLTRYRSLRESEPVRKQLLILLGGFIAITLWETAPVPAWIGGVLLWNTGPSGRWLFTSGLLLMLASLAIWNHKLISLHPLRVAVFVLIGPAAGLVLKGALLIYRGSSGSEAFARSAVDAIFLGLAIAAGLAAWRFRPAALSAVMVLAITLMNVYGFGRFNPLQPAGPVFDVPESEVLSELRKAAARDGVVIDSRLPGAELNGLGLRSVAHVLVVPQFALFRQYFPVMDAEQFNFAFNRYTHIVPTRGPVPKVTFLDAVEVPREVFVPVRNTRRVVIGGAQKEACSGAAAGAIGFTSALDSTVTIEGWAPWQAETDTQGIRVLSARPLGAASLLTRVRADVAEELHDYGFVKSGFQLKVSSGDGNPLRLEDLVLVAFGTSRGDVRMACCGCPR